MDTATSLLVADFDDHREQPCVHEVPGHVSLPGVSGRLDMAFGMAVR